LGREFLASELVVVEDFCEVAESRFNLFVARRFVAAEEFVGVEEFSELGHFWGVVPGVGGEHDGKAAAIYEGGEEKYGKEGEVNLLPSYDGLPFLLVLSLPLFEFAI